MKKITKLFLTLAITVFATLLMTIVSKPEIGNAASKLAAPKITGTVSSEKTITISWKAVKGADGYKIYKYNSSKKKYKECGSVDASSPCFFEATGLKSGKTYKFKVAAYVEKSGKKTAQKKSSVKKAKTLSAQSSATTDFYVYDASGNKVSFSEYHGKPVIINRWATWCGPCVRELPDFDKLYKEYGDKVKFFMVNVEESEDQDYVMEFAKENGYSFPITFDYDYSVARLFSTGYIPVTVAIKADGTVVYFDSGTLAESSIKSLINEILE
ncbi:MAG: redoxin family protein [Lachnospiraceae bacterium]|nr:redoxin family protein [Lachnospiraceae bacterium]MBR4781605.1 redoxin family protein [Lachnospiraceae bacterium]